MAARSGSQLPSPRELPGPVVRIAEVRRSWYQGEMRRVAIVSGFDSQFKWGGEVGRRFYTKGWGVEFFCPLVRSGQISDDQLASLKLPFRINKFTPAEAFDSLMLFDFDAVVFSVPASLSEHGMLRLKEVQELVERKAPGRLKKRPIFVAGFVGVNYENRIGAVVCRRLSDVILANSEIERDYFANAAAELGFNQPLFLNGGLGLIDRDTTKDRHAAADGASKRFRVLFAVQPTVPKSKQERVYLLKLLIELAIARPDYDVVIKPRSRLDEQTFHKEEDHLVALLAEFFDADRLPPNLLFDYRPIQEQLRRTDLCLTISSTAALEAHAFGVPFAILTDLGIKEPYGAEFFVNCGCLVTAKQLAEGVVPEPDPEWIRKNVAYGDDHFDDVLNAINELLAKQERAGAPLPIQTTAYDEARFAAMNFLEAWRVAPRKVAMVNEVIRQERHETASEAARAASASAGGAGQRREQNAKRNGANRANTGTASAVYLNPWQRKARKLMESPSLFFADSKFVRRSPVLSEILRKARASTKP